MAKTAPIKILFLAVNSNKADFAREILNNTGACSCWSFLGRGISRGGILDILGLDSPEKTVFISVVPSKNSTEILAALCKDLELYKQKMGIAFTVPISAISRDALNEFLDIKKQNETELKEQQAEQKQKELELKQIQEEAEKEEEK